jgi:hypothetical protein
MKLAKDLHEGWVQSTRVTSYSNKDAQKLRKEIKMEAMKAAKEKAGYMLESVGGKVGGIFSVIEVPETPNYGYYSQYSNSNMYMKSSSEPGAGIENAGEIKLRYEVKVKFEIKD